jgi:uncharacterized protein YabN with tetrapyrrole methylase and pyrophosphatase domain
VPSGSSSRPGSLVAAGAGIKPGLHLTEETRTEIRRADDVLYLLAEVAPTDWIHRLNPAARSMIDTYRVDRDQREVYEELVEAALAPVRAGRRVCMVTYGHPAVFDDACHEAVRRARAEGHDARLLPAVSAMDCLFADLEIDPGRSGLQLFEATAFLDDRRTPDVAVPLILWQISVVGRTRTTDRVDREGLRALTERLIELYGSDHEAVVYEASPFPIGGATIMRLHLPDLADAPVPGLASLYVPPVATHEGVG